MYLSQLVHLTLWCAVCAVKVSRSQQTLTERLPTYITPHLKHIISAPYLYAIQVSEQGLNRRFLPQPRPMVTPEVS